MDARLRARLDSELPRLYPKLLAQAALMVARSGWRRRFDMDRTGVSEDLLHSAILGVASGRRKWDPERVDLWGVLLGAMRSIISNATHSPENGTESLDEPLPDSTGTRVDTVQERGDSAEEILCRVEDTQAREEALLAAAGNDPILLRYIEAMMDELDKPADVAKHMNIPVDAVYQAHRKLRRRVEARKEASRDLSKVQS